MPMESPPAESFWIQVEGEKLANEYDALDEIGRRIRKLCNVL